MGRVVSSGVNSDNRTTRPSGLGPPVPSRVVKRGQGQSGFHPPQQARSRAALQRLLASAEQVLVSEGLDEFTIARVAEHAGVSVGGVYRRFASKEQLIDAVKQALMDRLEQSMADGLEKAKPSLNGVVEAFTAALSEFLDESGRVIPAVLAGKRNIDPEEQGLQVFISLQQRFLDAAVSHQDQIRHSDPIAALNIAFRTVIGTGAHRAALSPWLPDGLTWPQWAREMTDMINAYLTAGPKHESGQGFSC